jgi:hypothetical protein
VSPVNTYPKFSDLAIFSIISLRLLSKLDWR